MFKHERDLFHRIGAALKIWLSAHRRRDNSIGSLNLPTRTRNALGRAGITTISQLNAWSDDDLLAIRELGITSLAEIRLAEQGQPMPTPYSVRKQTVHIGYRGGVWCNESAGAAWIVTDERERATCLNCLRYSASSQSPWRRP